MFDDDNFNTSPTAPPEETAPESDAVPAAGLNPPSSALVAADLRISSYWIHFSVFVVFAFGSLIILQSIVATYLAEHRHLGLRGVEKAMTTEAPIAVTVQLAWFGLILLFLYMTLGALPGNPFWRTVGWRRFEPGSGSTSSRALRYFFAGSGLALFVGLAGSRISPKEHLPIQELFKDRNGLLLLMSLAVLVAPLVEETLFRGYLYPLLARTASALAQLFGMEFRNATRFGVVTSILMTGTLFGLLHGWQLGWTWGLVGLLTMVGIVFTYVRARTGTVLASYLLHLGYNSMIAISTIAAMHGLKQI